MNGKIALEQRAPMRIGISGSGFIARGLFTLLTRMQNRFEVTAVLSRRALDDAFEVPSTAQRVCDASALCDACDVVLECSGHVAEAARLIEIACERGLPVVTMNAEFQATLGASFRGRGAIVEASGDQPGSIMSLAAEAGSMGFVPVVFGSQKGFLNRTPSVEDMQQWARLQGISLAAVTSFTDGTKVQLEQALVANASGAGIAKKGLLGPSAESLDAAAAILASAAATAGQPISDYALVRGGKGDVFVAATHPSPSTELDYYKLGAGPIYVLRRPYHLGHFEVPLTLDRLVSRLPPLLPPVRRNRISVLAIAKRDLPAGLAIDRAIGSFDLRGEAVESDEAPDHLPIGLLENCRLTRAIKSGDVVSGGDVEFDDPFALNLWRSTLN